MQKYVIAGLIAVLLVLGWLYRSTSAELTDTRTNLAVAEGVNKANIEATARLERSMGNTDKVLSGWNEDRTTLAGVRSATRQAIKEAMRDETFKAWAVSPVPPDAWRMLAITSRRNCTIGNTSLSWTRRTAPQTFYPIGPAYSTGKK